MVMIFTSVAVADLCFPHDGSDISVTLVVTVTHEIKRAMSRMKVYHGNNCLKKVYSKWSYASPDLRASKCMYAREITSFVSRII